MALLKLCFFVLSVVAALGQSPDPTVRVPQGTLQGRWRVTPKGKTYASFEGVPYARPPVGKYRFKEPQQLKPWTGTWDATRTLSRCLQYEPSEKKIIGSENCLFVNVYTPELPPAAGLPVIVMIHGGAFMYGSGSLYDPLYFMDKNVILVTLNYRLGPLGFLSTGDDIIPGNNGLKDQAFALHWIRQNIMLFGGNPHSITITGCSAGGASVHYHYLSPLSRGAFNRGIAFSGSAFTSWAHAVKPAQKARALAASVGCPVATSRDILDCLKYRPAEVLVNAQVDMLGWKDNLFTPFVPTAEATNVRDPFLTQYPFHAARMGAMQNLPLITSVTSEEGLYPAAAYQAEPGMLEELETHWQQLASHIFEYNDTLPLDQRPAVAAKIKERYLGNRPVSQETFPQLVQALGDRLFVAEVGRLASLHAIKSNQPVYVYRFSYRGSKSLSHLLSYKDVNYGVSHADDVMQILNFAGMEPESADDFAMVESLINMITSYASTGVPKFNTPAPEWTPVKPGAAELNYMEISSPTKYEMKSSADFGQRSFWDSLGFIENENYHLNIRDEL